MIHATKTGRVMTLAAAVAMLISASAIAGKPDRARLDINRDGRVDFTESRHYGVLDSNQDGRYSLDEIRAAHPNLTQKEYADFDANLDGRVTKDELRLTTDRPGGR